MFSTPEEDEMGSPQPSAGAQPTMAALRLANGIAHMVHPALSPLLVMAIARDIDAYAAAALTDEQRDVLTVWGWMKEVTGPGDSLTLVKTGALGIEEARVRHTDIAMLAQWVREQGAKGKRW